MSEPQARSDAHDEADDAHEGPIRTPRQLVATVVASFVVPIVVIILLVNYVAFGDQPSAGSEGLGPEAVARRIQPVGTVEVRDVNDVASLKSGEQVYQAQCVACHSVGAANAPKTGDVAAWAPRLRTGLEALVQSSLKGKGAMPPQGGGDFNDLEITRAVVWLANQSGGKFPEPALPAAGAAAASAPKQ